MASIIWKLTGREFYWLDNEIMLSSMEGPPQDDEDRKRVEVINDVHGYFETVDRESEVVIVELSEEQAYFVVNELELASFEGASDRDDEERLREVKKILKKLKGQEAP